MIRLENREGGTEPLWVHDHAQRGLPGVFTSAWMIQNHKALELINSGKCILTVVVDTNAPGHPTISLALQPVTIIQD